MSVYWCFPSNYPSHLQVHISIKVVYVAAYAGARYLKTV
ncbi:hypothetical protein FLA_4736 [Filimonas lacunae]|nr:hypothetical protein FLA_4736 [Filimonas lacunae]